jgi:Ras-related protein Rab-2A
MLLQFSQQKFKPEHQITIGVEFGAKNINLGEKILRIQIWDTVFFIFIIF